MVRYWRARRQIAVALLGLTIIAGAPQVRGQSTACFDPAAFGAKPNDGGDDRVAIQAAVNAAQIAGASVCFGPGNFDVSDAGLASIRISAPLGLIVRGAGPSTRIRMRGPAQGDWRLIDIVEPSVNVFVRDLTLDGSLRTASEEQTHLLHLTGPVARVTIERVWFDLPKLPAMSGGDCIRFVGTPTTGEVTDVLVRKVTGLRCDRSFVGFQRAVRRVRIDDATTYEVGDQAIDFEPTGHAGIFDVTISNSRFARGPTAQGAYTLAFGGDGADVAENITLLSTTLEDGGVHIIDVRNVTLDGVRMRGALNSTAPVLHIRKRAQGVRVLNSTIERPAHAASGKVVAIHHQSGFNPTDVSITNSVLLQYSSEPIVDVESLTQLVLARTTLSYRGAAGAAPAINGRGVIAALQHMELRDNRLDGPALGLLRLAQLSPTLPTGRVIVVRNLADAITQYGVLFVNAGPNVPPTISQNNFGTVPEVLP